MTILAAAPATAQESAAPLYQFQADGRPRWAGPENRDAAKAAGGRENRGAKGRAFETLAAGASLTLADIHGAGIIDRMWITTEDRSPEMLRGLRLDIYWDGAAKPAVSVPLGDFFGAGAGALVPMETALLASPEGRSYVSYIPMPFRTRARIVVTNEAGKPLKLIFWDVDFRQLAAAPRDALYFHAYWSRTRQTPLGRDFSILPKISGRGRFLGTIVTTFTNPAYGKSWWGEGEVKIYLDGDDVLPTLAGTGTEDYIGTGWGQGTYAHRFQGSPVADEPRGRWTFYRFHIPDPIFFDRDIRVDLQQIGGAPKKQVVEMLSAGVKLIPVTVDPGGRAAFRQLLTAGTKVTDPGLPDGWTNFYRSDDVSAIAFFYLDKPMSGLPPLPAADERLAGLRPPAPPDRKPSGPGSPGE
ncbi:DUF2961 domain-containing protein [Sphingomonas sp. JC676]|uniref:glycoside hydrolase family 172 protein n=1 Tax=Sphingomonas sp. JC676 TaxID=2768065 RepID=UPI0016580489|nr:glycoside hydrolase family 172 protein [Sphingomonas sp. JC676]MBC9033912.1 DUF2961 domain-containing protein [Sphingomonas sp. JC676]